MRRKGEGEHGGERGGEWESGGSGGSGGSGESGGVGGVKRKKADDRTRKE